MLSKNAQNIQNFLSKKDLHTKVIEFPESTRTAEDAARAIGCEVGQIVKSLIFRKTHTKKAVLVLASGANRVNEKAIAKLLGEKIEKADANFTREITGFAIGGIPPIGHKELIETLIDEDLLTYKEIWAAAGTSNAVFNLDSSLIAELTQGKIISIK